MEPFSQQMCVAEHTLGARFAFEVYEKRLLGAHLKLLNCDRTGKPSFTLQKVNLRLLLHELIFKNQVSLVYI